MILDVIEFRRYGLACRRVADLNIPVSAWRAAMRQAGRRLDAPVHTFLVPPRPATAVDRQDQLVYAVRTSPPPEVTGLSEGLLWWRRVDELAIPLSTARAAVRRFALAEGVRLHTFLAATADAEVADRRGRRIYAVWARHGPDPFSIIAPPPAPTATATGAAPGHRPRRLRRPTHQHLDARSPLARWPTDTAADLTIRGRAGVSPGRDASTRRPARTRALAARQAIPATTTERASSTGDVVADPRTAEAEVSSAVAEQRQRPTIARART